MENRLTLFNSLTSDELQTAYQRSCSRIEEYENTGTEENVIRGLSKTAYYQIAEINLRNGVDITSKNFYEQLPERLLVERINALTIRQVLEKDEKRIIEITNEIETINDILNQRSQTHETNV